MGQVKIAVAPAHHEWVESISTAVIKGGALVVEPQDAEAIVWLGKEDDDLRKILHPGIRWVQLRAAGVEYWLASGEIDDRRYFTSSRGAYRTSVGEHAVALILAAARNLHHCARIKTWDRQAGKGRVLRGSTVGIIGAGGIGQQVVHYLQPFGVNLIAVTRSGREVEGASESRHADELGTVWLRLDFAVILAPATDETKGLIDRATLDALPDHAWVINLARGSLVDTDALVDALKAGTIGGAALDVTDPEPLVDGHPLWDFPNVLITPHAANPKNGSNFLLEEHIVENLSRFSKGETLLGLIDIARGY